MASQPEKQIQNAILREFATRFDMRLWRAETGAAYMKGRGGKLVLVRFGLKGQADLSGILPGGVRLEIEVKAKAGRQSKDQQRFGEMIERFGGCYVVARGVDDVWDAIREYIGDAA